MEEPKTTVTEGGGLLFKQKLECALQLARTVSLDFNNALTSILGHTSLLLSKAEANHPWRHSLLEVEKSASRAAEVVNESIVFSRQEKEGHQAPEGNLNTVVTRCVDFFRVRKMGIVWKTQLERELFTARFEEAKVQQALTKVLENSVEAITTPEGQIIIQTRNVELAEATQDRNVRLAPARMCALRLATTVRASRRTCCRGFLSPFSPPRAAAIAGWGWRWFTAL